MKANFDEIQKEISRFVGEQSFAYNVVIHWLPMSREGCLALRDSGVKMIFPSYGERQSYNSDPASLPYGYATHEQFFYPDYYAYQPDYMKKVLLAAEIVSQNGYEFIFF